MKYDGIKNGSEIFDNDSREKYPFLLNKQYHVFIRNNHVIGIPLLSCENRADAEKVASTRIL